MTTRHSQPPAETLRPTAAPAPGPREGSGTPGHHFPSVPFPLARAEAGLLLDLVTDCVRKGGMRYEVVVTGQVATADALLERLIPAAGGRAP